MKHRIFLNDGPIKDLQLIGSEEEIGSITAVDLELYEKVGEQFDPDDGGIVMASVSYRYERFDSWTTEEQSEMHHAFFKSDIQLRTSPVSAGLWASLGELLSKSEAERWNHWRWTLLQRLENCRETAREYGCNEVRDQLETALGLVSNVPTFSEVE